MLKIKTALSLPVAALSFQGHGGFMVESILGTRTVRNTCWLRSQSIAGHVYTHLHNYLHLGAIYLSQCPYQAVFGKREKTTEPRRNPYGHRNNM